MTSKELTVAGVSPTREEIHDFENIWSRMEDPAPGTIHDSESREDGEIRSENKFGGEEDISNIDVDLNELVVVKAASPPPAFVFGESKVTADLIKEYENAGFFPVGDGHPSSGEQVPAPEANEVIVFQDFFTCGLRFPCDLILPSILERFSVKIHQLTPNSFLELLKFFWIMKTFMCTFGTDIFARLFELVIEKDILKLDDEQYYEAYYECCTFNTRRQNSRNGLTRIQLTPYSKTNLSEDWRSYWFYVKVDMSKISGYTGPAYPFYSPMELVTATCTALYNNRTVGFKNCENAFFFASTILGGRDAIEEFVAAEIWPISDGWKPANIVLLDVDWATQQVSFPRFNLRLRRDRILKTLFTVFKRK
jgi:hypothetical protein